MTKTMKRILILSAMALLGILSLVFAIGFDGAPRHAYASEYSLQLLNGNGNGGVYYERNRIPIESAEILSNASTTTIRQGESVELDVLLVPYFAIETVENIVFQIGQGINLADLNGNVLTVRPNATIGGAITVFARVDDVRTTNTLTFNVGQVPVEAVIINTTQTVINQGASLNLNTTVLPVNATNRVVRHQIIEGAAFATVTVDGTIRANNNLPRGDLSITVRASSLVDDTIYAIKSFDLFVPTRMLSLSIGNDRVVPGSLVTIIPEINSNATIIYPEYEVISGHEYYEYIIGNTIRIANIISSDNPQIVIRGMRDNIQAILTVQIYIPATALSVTTNSTMQQGGMLNLTATPTPANASLANLQFFIEDDTYATIENGIVRARILPGVLESTVKVWGQIGNVKSNVFEITILNPNVVLTADNLILWSANSFADSTQLFVFVNDIEQTSNISFVVLSGQEFIDGAIVDGLLRVRRSITASNPIQIRLRAMYGGQFESNDIILTIRIAVQSITIIQNITEVEGQRSYDFSAFAGPTNAHNRNAQLHYEIIAGGNYATINSTTGLLQVNSTAPVGGEITIRISHPDGFFITHTVTVRSVFATSMEVDRVYRDGDEISISNGNALPGSVISFGVLFPTPFNVSSENKVFTIALVSGNTSVATIVNGNQIRIATTSTIHAPEFNVRITSNQNGIILTHYKRIMVYFPVQSISLSRLNNRIELVWGERVNISNVASALVNPANANSRTVSFKITHGHAEIVGNQIQVSNNNALRARNLTITLEAFVYCTINGRRVATLSFNIFIPVQNFTVSVNNANPYSAVDSSSTITLNTSIDSWATIRDIRFYVVASSRILIDPSDIGSDGYLLSSTFRIRRNLTAQLNLPNRNIEIRASRVNSAQGLPLTNISATITNITVQIAVTSATAGGTINRGNTAAFNPTANRHATTSGWRYVRSSGLTVARSGTTITGTVVSTPRNTPGGTIIWLEFEAISNSVSRIFRAEWTVNALNSANLRLNLSNGSSNQSQPQLRVGSNVAISATNVSSALSLYGASFVVRFLNASNQPVLTDANATLSGNTVTMNPNASGNATVRIRVIVTDGASTFYIDRTIYAFRPMSGNVNITNAPLIQRVSTLTLGAGVGWDSRATYHYSNLVLRTDNNFAFFGNDNRTLTLTSTRNSRIYVNAYFYQPYNNGTVRFPLAGFVNIPVYLRTVTFNNQHGFGGATSAVVINSMAANQGHERVAAVPSSARNFFVFDGYFTAATGGVRIFDVNGNRTASNAAANITRLYAQWRMQYYVIVHSYHGDGNGTFFRHSADTRRIRVRSGTDTITPFGSDRTCRLRGYFTNTPVRLINANTSMRMSSTFTISFTATTPGQEAILSLVWNCDCGRNACVAEGTLITLADGSQKPVEELSGEECLLVWNFTTGAFDSANIVFIESSERLEFEIVHLHFSDNSYVKVIAHHAFWSFDLNRYVLFTAENAKNYIGQKFKRHSYDLSGFNKVRLINVKIYYLYTTAWSPVTVKHLNFYTNGLLSMPGATSPFMNVFYVDSATIEYYGTTGIVPTVETVSAPIGATTNSNEPHRLNTSYFNIPDNQNYYTEHPEANRNHPLGRQFADIYLSVATNDGFIEHGPNRDNVQALGVNPGTISHQEREGFIDPETGRLRPIVEVRLRYNFTNVYNLNDTGWRISQDTHRGTVAGVPFYKDVKSGALIIQTRASSYDEWGWVNTYRENHTNVGTNDFTRIFEPRRFSGTPQEPWTTDRPAFQWETEYYPGYRVITHTSDGKLTIFTPSGRDLQNGVYIRIIFAYEIARTEGRNTTFRNIVEETIFFVCNSAGELFFTNMFFSSEELNSNQLGQLGFTRTYGTIRENHASNDGFRLNFLGNEGNIVQYRRNGNVNTNWQPAHDGQAFFSPGRYEFKVTTPLGNERIHTRFINEQSTERNLEVYFGGHFIKENSKEVFSTIHAFPVFVANYVHWQTNQIGKNHMPLVGKILRFDSPLTPLFDVIEHQLYIDGEPVYQDTPSRVYKNGSPAYDNYGEPIYEYRPVIARRERSYNGTLVKRIGENGVGTRDAHSGTITQAGFYRAIFANNQDYFTSNYSGDVLRFVWQFFVIDDATTPSLNHQLLRQNIGFSDFAARYYGVTLRAAGGGNVTFAHLSRPAAVNFAYTYFRSQIMIQGNNFVFNGNQYSSQLLVLAAVLEAAENKVQRRHFDATNPNSFRTIENPIGHEFEGEPCDKCDACKNSELCEEVELVYNGILYNENIRYDVVVFAGHWDAHNARRGEIFLNDRIYEYIDETGQIVRGRSPMRFFQVAEQESNNVVLEHTTIPNARFTIPFDEPVEATLRMHNAPTGRYRVVETNSNGLSVSYYAIYIRQGDNQTSVDVTFAMSGRVEEIQLGMQNVHSGARFVVNSFAIHSAQNELDPYGIIKIERLGNDGFERIYQLNEIDNIVINQMGNYIIHLVDRLGNNARYYIGEC